MNVEHERTMLGENVFRSELRQRRIASWLGVALGVAFVVCFLTGLVSHLIQHPPSWFVWPSRPTGLYRVTQGLHVATGIATIPLLGAKLWTVYPKLFRLPPIENLAHGLERASLLPLVGGSIFLLFSGVGSIARWYPYRFSFPPAHYWVAWITVGALIVHVGAKAWVVRASLGKRDPMLLEPAHGGLTRRRFLGAVAAAAGALTVLTIGQTIAPLRSIALLAPRRPGVGPQGFPVNKTAASAGVIEAASSPDYLLKVEVDGRETSLSLDELRAMAMREAMLPIACVDGWSANVRWRGVPLGELLASHGVARGRAVRVESLQDQSRAYSSADVNASHAWDPDTLLALECNGEPLALDHGYPVRLIAPNQPGVLQTKWVGRVVAV